VPFKYSTTTTGDALDVHIAYATGNLRCRFERSGQQNEKTSTPCLWHPRDLKQPRQGRLSRPLGSLERLDKKSILRRRTEPRWSGF
jgi:hypothetical protein